MGALYYLKQKLVDFANVIQTNENRTDTVPSSAVVYGVNANLNKLLVTRNYDYDYTVNANSALEISATDFGKTTPSGYTPVGIITFTTRSNNVIPRSLDATALANGAVIILRNVSSAAVSAKVSVRVLYARSASVNQ